MCIIQSFNWDFIYMLIYAPKETHENETRCAITPETARKLSSLGAHVTVEQGTGIKAGYSDEEYAKAGASIDKDRPKALAAADCVLRVKKPDIKEIQLLKKGCAHISFLDPFNEKELVEAFMKQNVSAVSMELVPRTTRAQKLDALSSQASLAGYSAVIIASRYLPKALPMMVTPAGTIMPARVFVIGAGVLGLQAIATAKRLGARVDAFDPRPEAQEQIISLGARFMKVDLGQTEQTKDGYAKALTEEQLKKQREAMIRQCAVSDIVITAAQVFGKKAPVVVTKDMLSAMRPGSVAVDTAIENGGNIEGSVKGKAAVLNGVLVIAMENLAGLVPRDASLVYANNLAAYVEEFWDKDKKTLALRLDDDIIRDSLVTHEGRLVSAKLGITKRQP